MIRMLLFAAALITALFWLYFWKLAPRPYKSYSEQQLELFDDVFNQLAAAGKASEDDVATNHLRQEERSRRALVWILPGMALALGIAAYFAPKMRASAPRATGEDARLAAFIGDPKAIEQGARQKAASLLGVALSAPPAVIEAALQAQLEQRDPSKLAGMAPDLQKAAEAQRQELIRARDLLVRKA